MEIEVKIDEKDLLEEIGAEKAVKVLGSDLLDHFTTQVLMDYLREGSQSEDGL